MASEPTPRPPAAAVDPVVKDVDEDTIDITEEVYLGIDPLTPEQHIRMVALDFAKGAMVFGTQANGTDLILQRADAFANYIKDGMDK